jgi:hypothetical protein
MRDQFGIGKLREITGRKNAELVLGEICNEQSGHGMNNETNHCVFKNRDSTVRRRKEMSNGNSRY